MEDVRHFNVALDAAFVLKSLERIGDHARNIARIVLSIAREGDAAPLSQQPAATR
jgi:phosphate transport system protein